MATYKPLQSVALTAASTSVTFSGIDQNYTDLIVVASVTVATAGGNMVMTFNGDTTSGLYSKTQIEGTGSSVFSGRTSSANNIGLSSNMGEDITNPSIQTIQLLNYANTSVFKTVLVRQTAWWAANSGTSARVGLWRNTNAITSITLSNGGTNFSAGSTFDLYGIKSGAPQALGGDLVTTDGNYWYHTFRSTQTFTPLKPLTVDYLVVAGGGAGGNFYGGGGGAGGYRTSIGGSALSLTAQSYSVTVGAGGAGGAQDSATNGNDSVFSTITSTGGGKAGGYSVSAGVYRSANTGGSGGGGGGDTGTGTGAAGNTPSTSPSQGNNGGNGVGSPNNTGGGGGGSSAVGTAGNGSVCGSGGNGTSNSISGSSVTYAGGGGGGGAGGTTNGSGGTGGGGAGGGASGTANTGGGAGGGASGGSGGSGGSGIVIVRYPV